MRSSLESAGRNRRAFISYATLDAALATRVCAALEADGYPCWIAPRDILPGSLYADGIVQAINETDIFVLILSAHSLASPHVGKEIERASSKRRPIVVLRTDSAPLTRAFEYFLSESQWIEVGTHGEAAAIKSLGRAAKQHLLAAVTESRVDAPPAATTARTSRFNRLAAIIGAVIVILLGASYAMLHKRPPLSENPSQVGTNGTTLAPADKSIAVLPFIDMSEKKDQEYFSDGLSEELIDRVAHAQNLKVIARTSSFQFKGKNDDVRTIGQRLGVAHLLEGSVRTSGDSIRVTAQLINTLDGSHLWSETYDRKMGDIFKIQDDISSAVVAALKANLAMVPASAGHSQNVESYNKVLMALYLIRRGTKKESDRALSVLDEAIQIDPANAEAWFMLSNAYYTRAIQNWMPASEAYPLARNAAERAIQIEPKMALAHRALALAEEVLNNDVAAAKRETQRSIELDPSLGEIPLDQGILAYKEGRVSEAVPLLQRASELNPLNAWTLSWLANAQYAADNLTAAEHVMHEVLDINPEAAGVHCMLGRMLLSAQKPEAALQMMSEEPEEASRLTCMPAALFALGRRTEADAMLVQAQAKFADSMAYSLAYCYVVGGDKESAFKWLTKARDSHDLHLKFLNEDPGFRVLHSDARYDRFRAGQG